jgi:hypothetical protein
MNSYEYMDEVKRIKGLDTDYKAAKMLGWAQNKITQYKNGTTMDNEAARQVAEVLDIPLMKIIADMEEQRQKDPAAKRAWSKLAKMTKQAGKATTNLLIYMALFLSTSSIMYIMLNSRRANNVYL